ncbi:DUF6263 family protein [Patiriisocius hiemis]|uniref:DUF6263 family protein n=1 Tax=Patiriisocius hiemis TaxID=3075604 RepID=A0ABU2YAZ5_9FLAO|nr:DUF6263 family protein [Constantimarinum sp. W242]MDT0554410.1 DUF6263 family protein [Constantimarinum sp. W242]
MQKFLTIFTFFLCAAFQVQAQNILQYNMSIGDSYTIEQEATQDIIQTMDGADHEMKNTILGEYVFEVISVTDSTFVMNFHFKSLLFKTESGIYGTLMDIDTNREAEEDDIEANIFKGLLNNDLQIVVYKTGNIKTLTGTDAIIDSMLEKAGIEDDFTKNIAKKGLEKEFGDESMKESMIQMLYLFSDEPVSKGSKWETSFNGDLKGSTTYSLQEYSTEEIKLVGDGPIELNTVNEDVTMILSGTQNVIATCDTETGFMKNVTIEQTATGVTKTKQWGTVEVPTTINSTITFKRI